MWRQILKIAFRNLFKQKLFTSINIFGLAVGLAGSLLIAVFVWNELSYESMHDKANNIYRVAVQFGKTDDSMIMAGAMPALGPAAKEELPEVEEFTRLVVDRGAQIKLNDEKFNERNFFMADESVLSLFNIKIVSKGDNSPLSDPFDVLLSQTTAEKYFGKDNPVGKLIEYREQTLKVTGVFEDIVGNTQIKPDLLTSYKTKEIVFPTTSEWGNFGQDVTYLLLNNKIGYDELQQKITNLVVKNTSQEFADMLQFIPERLPDIYLNSATIGDLIPHGNKNYVYLFSSIAFFVLLIASLNFINLSTARSFKRAKEVGIKKVMGARRNQLVFQFLAESLLVTFISLLIGIILFEIFFPVLTDFLGIEAAINYLKTGEFYLFVILILFAVGVLAGIYPALYLTRFNPLKTVKNEVGKSYKGIGFRKVLVVLQFAISILLIFGTTVIFQQLDYMRNYDIGIDKDDIVLISYSPKGEEAEIKYETLKSQLLTSNYIQNVSGVYTLPGSNNVEKQTFRLKETPAEEQKVMRFNGVDYSFVNTFSLNLIAGRNFNKEFSTDRNNSVIINATAAKELGLTADEIVGKQAAMPSPVDNERLVTIVGVIADFNIESLHKTIEPVVLYVNPQRFYTLAAKVTPENTKQALSFMKAKWKEIMPGKAFHFEYLNEQYSQLYAAEEKIYQLFTIFSFLAIYIAALGLLGLSSFSAEQRKKEIGIRKVLGSSVKGIVGLLSKDYLKLVIVSAIVSLPLSFYLMNSWLNDFAFRIDISWQPFILSFILSLVISLVTVSSQALRAATVNPINTIKYE